MKKKSVILILILCLAACILHWAGMGYYTSSAAVSDLEAELEALYGEEYTGKETESGTEDMVFVIKPKTWFLTNWNLRNALGLDYKYSCSVVFTDDSQGRPETTRTIIYEGIDPMGKHHTADRAYLDLSSKTEK